MSIKKSKKERGFALIYMAVMLTGMLLFSGLAIDGGRAYVVKAQLSKAVDGAALGAARALNSGNPRQEATQIFKANFPDGFLGTTGGDPTQAGNFFASAIDPQTGINTVTVTATTTLPTTFMRLGNINDVTVSSMGEATRRMVDLSLVIDVSSSIGGQWPTVRDAIRSFVNSFDALHDRVALMTFGNGASVLDAMPAGRGFDKNKVLSDVPNNLPGGSTNMVEGLYHGWDELRTVAPGQQSGLRVIVLFTDGASNGVPGNWDNTGTAKSIRTYDFPKRNPDPDNQTWNNPTIGGLYDTSSGAAVPAASTVVDITNMTNFQQQTIPGYGSMPGTSWHTHARSSGIPSTYPFKVNYLNVNGTPQDQKRTILVNPANNKPYASVWNINNAARNLVEIIANDARNDNGDYKIRLYTIGMGALVRLDLGTQNEKSEDILKRIANDKTSPDFNANQLEGMYFYAQTAADVAPAFQGIQNQILRLSK